MRERPLRGALFYVKKFMEVQMKKILKRRTGYNGSLLSELR